MRFRTVLAIGLCFVLGMAQAAQEPPPVSDVRVLIDMSGSMKKNDPDNLRIPALRLLTQLMPNGSRSGVWTFGQYVNMLVPRAEVDAKWKAQAYGAAAEINSLGMFTNIGDALKKATWDWKRPAAEVERSVVLLTDGLVDVSKDPKKNQAARREILEKILPRLKQAGVVVNTIALSNEADKAFLQQLSASTGGWHQDVHSAEQLERTFLRMFEKSVPTETLPLVGNKVRVDSSVRELTLLVFRGEHGKKTSITLPSGTQISYEQSPKNVRWKREARYDLVTVVRPPAGEWTIDAELDPDNRVMVVTNMRVKATKLPNALLAGDELPYYVSLIQDGKVIDNALFLDLVNISLERYHDSEMQRHLAIVDDGQGVDERQHDGKFSAKVYVDVPAGDYEYHLTIDGGTFQRAGRQLVRVVDGPVAVSARKVSGGNPAHYALNIVPYADIIDPDTLKIDAVVVKAGVGELAVDIPRVGPTEWRLDMNIKEGDQFEVKVAISAQKPDGEVINKDMGSYAMGEGIAGERVALPPAPEVVDPEPQHDTAPVHDAPAVHEPAPDHHDAVDEPGHGAASDHGPAHPEPAHHEAPPEEPPVAPDHEAVNEETPVDHAAKEEEGHHAAEDQVAAEAVEEEPDWLMTILKVLGLNALLIGGGVFVWWKWFRTPKEAPEDGEDDGDKEVKEEKKEKGDD